jgi:hypothetical protein
MKNKVLRKIFGLKKDEISVKIGILHKEEYCDLQVT